jgi:hypothetical protein
VLVAEVVKYYYPRLVQLHNYASANGLPQKKENWTTLNHKVLKVFGFQVAPPDVDAVARAAPGAVEGVLRTLQVRMAKHRRAAEGDAGQQGAANRSRRGAGVPAGGANKRESQAAQLERMHREREMQAKLKQQGQQQQQQGQQQHQQGQQPGQGQQHFGQVGAGLSPGGHAQDELGSSILMEKEQTILDLRETVEILEVKVNKLEALRRLKDQKIAALERKLAEAGLG